MTGPVHGSCAALDGRAVLVLGPPGAGKSDLVLRLIGRGFTLVADDQVIVEDGVARPPERLAGLIEVRGMGICRLPHVAARLALAVGLGRGARLPEAATEPRFGVPLVTVDPDAASAPDRVMLALRQAGGGAGDG